MCGELMKLVAERAEIETKYSNKLKMWCKKWNDVIDKGTEYGTNKAILLGSLQEADAMGEVHNTIKDRLMEVHAELKKWKNDNYKKQMVVAGCKEAKQFEDDFRKAQKPWAKKLAKVQKTRKDYYNACKLEKVASTQATSQVGMANTTEDQVKKLQEKVEKCQRDVEQTRDKYEEALKDLESYKIIYMGDMTEVFERTQNFEEKRLGYFKDILIGVHSCLDLTRIPKIAEIYKQFRQTIELSDASQDLKWWSQNHGIDMPMNWPTFEEFSSESSMLSRKDKSRSSILISNHNNESMRMKTAPNTLPHHKEPAAEKRKAPTASIRGTVSQPNIVQRHESYDSELNPFKDDPDGENEKAQKHPAPEEPSGAASANHSAAKAMPTISEDSKISNPFDEDDDEAEDFGNQPGVPVQALFDYDGQEEDELSFKSGDKFEKLKDRDDQGWCTGRKNGRVGLYPDNYVKVITP